MKLLEKLKNKKSLAIIITLFVGMFLGGLFSPLCSDSNHEGIEEKVSELEGTVKEKDAQIATLNEKVDSAEPYFKMTSAEKEKLEIETAKQEEKNRKEQEKLEEEQRKQEEKEKQAKLESRSVKLGNGTYLVGKDIPEGVYDLYAVRGGGNVQSSDYSINVIMGTKGDSNFYQREQQNVALVEGTKIELSRVTVKFVPDDGYVIND